MHTIKLYIEDNEVLIEEDDNIKESSINELYKDKVETKSFSNHSANLIEEWKDSSEDDIWK